MADFDYELSADRIAQVPADRRDASRLLVVPPAGPIAHRQFRELPALLPAGALLVVNDTRVIRARLRARKPTGGLVELLLVEPEPDGATWRCLLRGSLAPGTRLELLPPPRGAPSGPPPAVTFLGRLADGTARVAPDCGELPLDTLGELPLPPYIRREAGATAADQERYQTLFAREPGAVAAPTAGLHFTAETLAELATRGIDRAAVTLHVGPGTFAPVRDDDLESHVMHAERYHVPPETARAHAAARASGRPVVAVGTTVVRALESAAKGDGSLRPGPGATRLFIRPGHRFRTVDLLLTNFHMPRSTLLMLVAAFAGRERILTAYRAAAAAGYRFFSYGDATLLYPEGAS